MRRSSARDVEHLGNADSAAVNPVWVIAGFAVGAAAGWVLGELTGVLSRDRVRRYLGPSVTTAANPDAPQAARDRIRAALEADVDLGPLDLRLVPAGRTAVELHGWVPSRLLRARATRLAATAAGAIRLIDCLLVRGEDDRPAEDESRPAEAPQSA
jgi:hypothetical protein